MCQELYLSSPVIVQINEDLFKVFPTQQMMANDIHSNIVLSNQKNLLKEKYLKIQTLTRRSPDKLAIEARITNL